MNPEISEDERAQLQRYAKWNVASALVSPILIAVIAGLVIYFAGEQDPYVGVVAVIFPIIGIIPLVAGYVTSLRWKTKPPVLFFFIGLGISAAFGCVWAGCVWGFCARM